jgi:hypothetical protein
MIPLINGLNDVKMFGQEILTSFAIASQNVGVTTKTAKASITDAQAATTNPFQAIFGLDDTDVMRTTYPSPIPQWVYYGYLDISISFASLSGGTITSLFATLESIDSIGNNSKIILPIGNGPSGAVLNPSIASVYSYQSPREVIFQDVRFNTVPATAATWNMVYTCNFTGFRFMTA